MTEETSRSLRELQEVDLQIESLKERIAEFDPLLAEVEEPAMALEQEVNTLRGRLKEMQVEERRLERSADDRRARLKTLKERLKAVRNLREEAAVRAEMDLLETALGGDEQEALTLLDQIRKMEDRLEEQEQDLKEAREEVEPRRLQLLEEKEKAQDDVARLKNQRQEYTDRVRGTDLKNYERIRSGGRTVAVAALTPDGACGNCFGMVPIQLQNEIRKGSASITCEACGVLLSPGEGDS